MTARNRAIVRALFWGTVAGVGFGLIVYSILTY